MNSNVRLMINHLYSVSLLDILLRFCKVQCISVKLFCTCSGYDIPSCSHKRSTHSMSSMLPQVWSNVVHIDHHQSWSNPNCLEKKAQGVDCPQPWKTALLTCCSRVACVGGCSPCEELLPSFVYIGAGAGSVIHKYDEPLNNMHGLFGYLSGCMCQFQQCTNKLWERIPCSPCSLLAMSNKCWHTS